MRVLFAVFACTAAVLAPSSAEADALAVTPTSAWVEPAERITFKGVGGSGGYRWSLLAAPSGGTIDQAGIYVAGPRTDEDDIVLLTDPVGNTTQATVHVTPDVNLAGGAEADNRCALGGQTSAAGGLAIGLALMLMRRRRG